MPSVPRAAMPLMIALGLWLIQAGCWHGEQVRPSWVDGTSLEFLPTRYLVGVGQGDTRSGAEEQAYAAVSKIFKAEIEAQSKDWESYLIVEGRSHATAERRLALEKVTRVSTEKVLENVRVLDAWFDPKNRQYYALAGMDKAQAEPALIERIRELDDTVASQLNEARRTPDKLSHARNLKRAARNLVVREAYNADLRVIRANGQGNQPGYRVADLMNELEQFLAGNLAVAVNFDGDQAEPVRRALIEGLAREGLSVAGSSVPTNDGLYADGLKPELLVTGIIRVWLLDIRDPQFRYVRWCSDAVIEEVATKRVIGAISKGGKEGHLTEREAVAKAVRVMQQQFSSELAHSIAGYIYGDTELPSASSTPPGCPRDERLEHSGVPHQ
ncbi:LPP20 family lipoprotein [Nitrospira sp. Nam80]